MEERYRSLNGYFRERFGGKVYKLALDGGMTCPNRDGTAGTEGCIFCHGGAGEFAERGEDIVKQIERAKARVARKTKENRYVAYFQSYTNTYAPVCKLKHMFSEAINCPEIVALSIATRPDCLPDNVTALLAELNEKKPVFVELGLQTVHERTAKLIGRGYPLPVFDEAIKKLREKKLETIVHVILGLPHESAEDMLKTVRYVGESGADGIKLQLLHVLRGTALEKMYENGEFSTLSRGEYIDILCRCIEALPPRIVIHRLTGDAPKRLLVAPAWSADKKAVLNEIRAELERRNVVQGKNFERK